MRYHLLGGLVAGTLAALVFGAVVSLMEIVPTVGFARGYISRALMLWFVGFATAVGVRFGGYLAHKDECQREGILAGGLAAIFMTLAFYLGWLGYRQANTKTIELGPALVEEENDHSFVAEELAVRELARQILRQRQQEGKRNPARQELPQKNHIPPEVMQQAWQRWRQFSPEQRRAWQKQCARQMLQEILDELAKKGGFQVYEGVDFVHFLSPFDGLAFLLAVAAAYKIGTGTYEPD